MDQLLSRCARCRIRRHPWGRPCAARQESFGALERLQELSTVPGFSARTIERRGFKFSDPDRWREAKDPGWDWKGHTSSDEICSQTFAHAVMWEWVANNATERARVATNYVHIVEHIPVPRLLLRGCGWKADALGPLELEYLNWFPHSIHDRRLNSAEITATLQLAFAMTGNRRYRDIAYRLFEQHGYLTNILSPMSAIHPTPDTSMRATRDGDEWNHSDDELAFFTYWVLCRFAFTPDLKAKYLAAVRGHWDIEKAERYPIWNFIYAGCGAREYDPAGLSGPFGARRWTRSTGPSQLPPPRHHPARTQLHAPGIGGTPAARGTVGGPNQHQPFILDAGDGLNDSLGTST